MENNLTIEITINGKKMTQQISPAMTLLDLIRKELNLKGTKKGCNNGNCGSCTVLMDGKPVNSCMTLAVQADGKNILTIEGLSDGSILHPIQESFIEKGAIQCGFCTPGMVISAKGLLDKNPEPTEDEIREGISGNYCRCTGYTKITDAVKHSAAVLRNEKDQLMEVDHE
ncbi:carbon-monoxide dehydrogenase small subunit [Dethiosulfatibacter aminovorans DSM 17477]|uniref:Carbon-monoxide dehydrogenase small subunit n=1 Tax=Dethiosulfatibacter aminovorans DSM 17477 TaxID=1121476 RepID=A0A1M6AAS9_9FIRM|nr:(2Fe-2S)-binding protein [Dethiosulfatibacter aminovorans]SHI33585.1 carbon-monoxide dehydrogenase small subunit [Dethiosulfatibacter aminovorans DSM 17477]